MAHPQLLLPAIDIPPELTDWVIDFNEPFTAVELRHIREGTGAKPASKPMRDEEGRRAAQALEEDQIDPPIHHPKPTENTRNIV
jgi:hypothetical protein